MSVRDENGRFVKGHTGNPNGRPPRSKEEKYLKKLSARCTFKKWQQIVDKAVEQAKGGDPKARQWLSDYLLGKPGQSVDITSGGERLTPLVIYLPEIDEDEQVEAESGAAGAVPS